MNIRAHSIYRDFVDANQASARHAERANQFIPTGTSRSLLRHPPFPFYVRRAEGVVSTDLDDNQRIDFHNNYTTLIHGHGHPDVMAAIEKQLPNGTTYSAPGAQELELTELLANRIHCVEQTVFNNSGTEAVMVALRIARACTGRNRIGKFEGGYHGSSDFVMVGGHDVPKPDDPVKVSKPTVDLAGLPASVCDDVILMRFNDSDAVREAVKQYGEEMAAIIVEPIQGAGGVVPADPEFLQTIREETLRAGIVLICDEVISLRQALGGAQGFYGLDTDLTTMAKTIGGGFPVGAVGGKKEFMRVLNSPQDGGTVANLGTFSANPMSVNAGLATMKLLDEAAISHLNDLGQRARAGLKQVIDKRALPAQVTGSGSLLQVHWTSEPCVDSRGPATADPDLNMLTFLGLCNRGVQVSMRGIVALSTPMTNEHIDKLIGEFDNVCGELQSIV
ncbi:MAG: aspartate aminotransferase family protein [Pseudomonadota bacterium]